MFERKRCLTDKTSIPKKITKQDRPTIVRFWKSRKPNMRRYHPLTTNYAGWNFETSDYQNAWYLQSLLAPINSPWKVLKFEFSNSRVGCVFLKTQKTSNEWIRAPREISLWWWNQKCILNFLAPSRSTLEGWNFMYYGKSGWRCIFKLFEALKQEMTMKSLFNPLPPLVTPRNLIGKWNFICHEKLAWITEIIYEQVV